MKPTVSLSLEVPRYQPVAVRHVAQASPEVGGEGFFRVSSSHSGLHKRQGRFANKWTRPSNQESQLAVEEKLSAAGGARW